MDSAAINSFIPTLDQVDSWYEIFTLLPILILLELLLLFNVYINLRYNIGI